MAEEAGIPAAVRAAYALDDAPPRPVADGWINRTLVVTRGGARFVLQRLHPIFTGPLNADIDAVTRRLEARGLVTPRVVPTTDGALFVEADGVWRMLTFVEGRTLAALSTPALARSAGALVARFHAALEGFSHRFAFTRPGAHDTPAHLAKLRALRAAHLDDAEAGAIADAILGDAAALPPIPALPIRIIHGDLKATNLLFEEDAPVARAIVDLDTLQRGTIAVELGDALRSWGNRTDESDVDARFDGALFEAALEGYGEAAPGLLTADEVDAIVPGVETIALELASRFAADVYEDRYFGFDAARFPSRRAHNLARARSQRALAASVRAQRDALQRAAADRLLV